MTRRLLTIAFAATATAGAAVAIATGSTAARTEIPVVKCPTLYGLGRDQYMIPSLPRSLSASVTPDEARRVSFYSDGWLTVLAPHGWHCTGVVGATGALDLVVVPSGVSSSRGLPDRRAAAVTARIPSPETGEVGGDVCSLFPDATPVPDSPCPAAATRERVVRLTATTVAYEDPPHVVGNGDPSGGPDPANGVAVYAHSRAAEATCTLPQPEHATCTLILNDFLVRHRF